MVTQNTNTTTIERAILWWGNLSAKERELKSVLHLDMAIDGERDLDEVCIIKIYLAQHPSETTPTSNGVIEGLEDAAKRAYKATPLMNMYSHRNAFKEGAQWHKETHYNPLFELCRELLQTTKDMEERMTRGRGILNRKDGESNWGMLNTSIEKEVIEKANNYLNK